MNRDEERIQRRREEIAELHRQTQEDLRQTEEEIAARRAERDRLAASPVQRRRQYGLLGHIGFYLAMLLVILVFGELAMTVGAYTGTDFEDAKRTGQATVLSCERHGPVGEGFGYWDECTADVLWGNREREIVSLNKRDFFTAEEIGTAVTIGDLGYSRGGRSFAREERPPRPLVTLAAAVLLMIAVLPLMALVWIFWQWPKASVRKLTRRQSRAP